MKRVHAASLAVDGGHGELVATGPPHHLCKRKAETSSQSIIFPAYLPTPHQFQCCLAKLLYNEPLHLQDLAFNIEIGGRGT